MNNSFFSVEPEVVDVSPKLREEEARVLRIVEAIRGVQDSVAWSTLKTELFDSLVNVLEKDIATEARKTETDVRKLNRLSGKLEWAEKYSDLSKLENRYMQELSNIRLKLNGKSE